MLLLLLFSNEENQEDTGVNRHSCIGLSKKSNLELFRRVDVMERTKSIDVTKEIERLMNDYNSGKMPHAEFSDKLAILRLLNEKIRLQSEALELAQFYEQGRVVHIIMGCLFGSDPTCDTASIETHFKALEEESDYELWSAFVKAASNEELQSLFKKPEKSKANLMAEVEAAEASLKELKERLRKKADLEGKETFEMHQTHMSHEKK